jgi:hypothetical protein
MSEEKPNNNNLINFIAATVETLRDQMVEMRDQTATKSDLAQLESRLTTKLEAEITAVRGDIEQVHLRLDSIDRALKTRLGQIEAELSRLRSVVYLQRVPFAGEVLFLRPL